MCMFQCRFKNTLTRGTNPMSPSIRLHLFASLKSRQPSSGPTVAIETGMRMKDLLAQLNIPQDEIKLVFVNGLKADLETRLHGGERVGIFPAIGGG